MQKQADELDKNLIESEGRPSIQIELVDFACLDPPIQCCLIRRYKVTVTDTVIKCSLLANQKIWSVIGAANYRN